MNYQNTWYSLPYTCSLYCQWNLQCAYPSVDHLFSLTDVSLLAQSISYLLNQRFNSRSSSSSPLITGPALRMRIAVKACHSYLHPQILPRRSSSPTSISGHCLVASLLLILRPAQSWWITSPSLPLEGGYSAPQLFSKKVFIGQIVIPIERL